VKWQNFRRLSLGRLNTPLLKRRKAKMTWSIYASGTPDEVKVAAEKAEVNGQSGGIATKALVAAVCDSIRPDVRDSLNVFLKSSGHSDANHHSLSIDLKAEPK
jgi:hypothetical protein